MSDGPKNQTSPQAKQVATPKQTGGAGYTFEDKVVASWLVHLLQGTSPLGSNGRVTHLSLQGRVDGWLLDDVIATVEMPSGQVVTIATSVKSNNQLQSDCSAPTDLVAQCWQQLLNEDFREVSQNTFLALVQASMPAEDRRAIDEVLNYSQSQSPEGLEQRIDTPRWNNEKGRSFYHSFECPEVIWEELGDESDPPPAASILQHVAIFDYDFLAASSQDEIRQVSICRDLVEDPSQADALWDRLKVLAREEGAHAADIDLAFLLDQLRGHVTLRDHPWFAGDWNKLTEESTRVRERISVSLKGQTLQRCSERERLASAVDEDHCVAVVGPTGAGKSGLIKLADSSLGERTIWLDATDLSSAQARHRTPLPKLLPTTPVTSCLVVENVEGLGSDDLKVLLDVLRAIGNKTQWRIVFTCRDLRWGHIASVLGGIPRFPTPKEFFTDGLDDAELNELAENFPALGEVIEKASLRGILRRPQALAFLLRSQGDVVPDTLVGEGTLVDWYWKEVVRRPLEGFSVGNLTKQLAEMQAMSHRESTPLSKLPDAFQSSTATDELNQRGIAVVDDFEHIRFEHGWVRDIALSRLLREELGEGFAAFAVSRAGNPYWHNAIRILSAFLLETDDTRWSREVSALVQEPEGSQVVALFFDAFLTSPRTSELLDNHGDLLIDNDSDLLRRLLASATAQLMVSAMPNVRLAVEQVVEWMETKSDADVCEATFEQWKFLFWLSKMPDVLTASTAQRLCHWVIELASNPGRVPWKERDGVYKSLCLTHRHMPHEARDIILDLAGLNHATAVARNAPSPFDPPDAALPSAWSRGPLGPTAPGFAEAVLENQGPLAWLLINDVHLFADVLLALCIEPPTHPWDRAGLLGHGDLAVIHDDLWDPPDPTNLWSLFLDKDFRVGLRTILVLVKHATEQWRDVRWDQDRTFGERLGFAVASIELRFPNGEIRTYVGNRQLMHWHLGCFACPKAVTSALMALEAWLYRQVKTDPENVERVVGQLLSDSGSVAIIGVLHTLAKRHPHLLDDSLSPLLTSPYLLLWSRFVQQDLRWRMLPSTWTVTEEHWERLRDWHVMDHRDRPFEAVVQKHWWENDLEWPPIEFARATWASRIGTFPQADREAIEELVDFFTPGNWIAIGEAYVPTKAYVEKVGAKAEAHQSEIEASHEMLRRLTIPMNCSRLLEDESAAASVDAADLWAVFDDDTNPFEVRVAGATVLVCEKQAWVSNNDEVRAQLTQTLSEVIQDVKANAGYGRDTVGSWGVTSFAGESAVALWSLDGLRTSGVFGWLSSKLPCGTASRRLAESSICRVVAGATDSDAGLVFRRICREFGSDSSEMRRALALALQFSRLIWLHAWLREDEVDPESIILAIEGALHHLPPTSDLPEPSEWGDIAMWTPPGIDLSKVRLPTDWYDGVNEHYLFSVFEWLVGSTMDADVSAASNDSEVVFLVGLWSIELACEAGRFNRRDYSHFARRSMRTYQLQNKLADTIARTAIDPIHGDDLFEQVMELTFSKPRPMGRLVAALGDALATQGVHSPKKQQARLQAVLNAILEHPEPEFFDNFDDTRAACLGLGKLQSFTWKQTGVDSGSGLRAHLAEFRELVVEDVRLVEQLIRFAFTTPGEPMQLEVAIWLAAADKRRWRGDRIVTLISNLLVSVWGAAVKSDPAVAENLLSWLRNVRPLDGALLVNQLSCKTHRDSNLSSSCGDDEES